MILSHLNKESQILPTPQLKAQFILKIDRKVQTFVDTVQTILGTLHYTNDNRQ
jgi:hypothetical protein